MSSGKYGSKRPATTLLAENQSPGFSPLRAHEQSISVRSSSRHQAKTDELEAHKEPVSPPSTTDLFTLADTRRAVQEALQTLLEQQRIPLEMAYFQGMSHTEIAAALGQPLGTVKDRIRTGMMHLRQRLKAYL